MELLTYFEQLSGLQWLAAGTGILLFWFLPALLALYFNPKQAKLIALACVPAGLSVIAWSGVMIWAVTGDAVNRYRRKNRQSS